MEFGERVIVADEDLDFENKKYTYWSKKNEADFEIGEEVSEEVKLIDLGRRAILALPKSYFKNTNTIIQIFTSNLKI
jgi:hypothetical protein